MKRKIMKTGILLGVCLCMTACKKESESVVLQVEEIKLEKTETAPAEEEAKSGEETEVSPADILDGQEVQGSIRVGTTGIPYSELLTQAKILLAKEGWDLDVITYEDPALLNQDVLDQTLDAHLFAHETYLESYNDVQGTELMTITPVIYEKYGIYSKSNDDLTNYTEGAAVGIPAEETGQAKALSFLRDLGYLSLKEGIGLTASVEDIIEDTYDIRFTEYTQDTVSKCLEECDYLIMGGDQAILAGLEPHKDTLAEETPQMESAKLLAAFLVTTPENAESEKIRMLEEALCSETIKQYVKEYYKEAYSTFAE